MDVSNIVSVTITKETSGVTQEGFGTPMIVGPNAAYVERVREYASLDAVAEDFETTDDEYKAANSIFSQDVTPEKIKIGRRATVVAEVQTLTFSADFVTGNEIDMDIHGTAITTVPFNTDHDTTMDDLAAAIQASSYVVTATVTAARVITITAQTAGIPTDIENIEIDGGASQPTATLATTTENVGITEDLIAINQEDPDWYGLIVTSRSEDEVLLAAAYIETKRKLFFTCSDDEDILDATSTDDIGAVLESKDYKRTVLIYSETPSDFPDAAWMGRCFPIDRGQVTFKFKNLSGITASDLTETQRTAAQNKNVNIYVNYLDQDMTEEGVAADGTYIDETRDIDGLQAKLEEKIVELLLSSNKIPYTDAGVATFENEIKGVLAKEARDGIITDGYTVDFPKVADVDSSYKEDRILPDGEFEAQLASAIHKAIIQGRVSI